MISSCSLLAKQATAAAAFMGSSRANTIIRHHSSSSLSKKEIANSKLQTFRKIISSRVSARRFEPNISIPDNFWLDILRMTMTSPSGFNLQPTHIILLRSTQLKSILSKHAMLGFGNQYRTNDASGIAVFISDLQPSKRIDRIYDMERQSGIREDGYLAVLRVAASFLTGESSTTSTTTSSLSDRGENSSSSTYLSSFLKQTFTHALSPIQSMPTMENVESWSYKNAGIMAQQYTMCATAHGLSTCMMEGYDARRVKEILRIPDRYGVPLMVATGYDYGTIADDVVHADIIDDYVDDDGLDKRTPRLEMNELFFGDTFGQPLDLLLDSNKNGTILPIEKKDSIAAA